MYSFIAIKIVRTASIGSEVLPSVTSRDSSKEENFLLFLYQNVPQLVLSFLNMSLLDAIPPSSMVNESESTTAAGDFQLITNSETLNVPRSSGFMTSATALQLVSKMAELEKNKTSNLPSSSSSLEFFTDIFEVGSAEIDNVEDEALHLVEGDKDTASAGGPEIETDREGDSLHSNVGFAEKEDPQIHQNSNTEH